MREVDRIDPILTTFPSTGGGLHCLMILHCKAGRCHGEPPLPIHTRSASSYYSLLELVSEGAAWRSNLQMIKPRTHVGHANGEREDAISASPNALSAPSM